MTAPQRGKLSVSWPEPVFVIGPFTIRNPARLRRFPLLYKLLSRLNRLDEAIEFRLSERRLKGKRAP